MAARDVLPILELKGFFIPLRRAAADDSFRLMLAGLWLRRAATQHLNAANAVRPLVGNLV